MNTARFLCTLALVALVTTLVPHAQAAAPARLQAILITASNEPSAKRDPRLAPYEAKLRGLLRFESFTFQGSDTDTLAAGARTTLVIGQGHELDLTAAADSALKLRIRWADKIGGRTLMDTGLKLNPGAPAIIGGMPTGRKPGEVYAVILVAR